MNNLFIKDLKIKDQDVYKKFFLSALLSDPDNFRMSYQDELGAAFPTSDLSDSFTLGAFSGSELAGVVSFEREGSTREKLRHKATLFRMYVAPAFRGKGVSRLLIDTLFQRVHLLPNLEQINLTVVSHNIVARQLYSSYGFKTFSVEHHAIKWHGKYATEEQMVCFLKMKA